MDNNSCKRAVSGCSLVTKIWKSLFVLLSLDVNIYSSFVYGESNNLIEVQSLDRKSIFARNSTAKIFLKSLLDVSSISFIGAKNESAIFKLSKVLHRTVDKHYGKKEIVWRGMMLDENRTGFCTLVRLPNGRLAGSVTTETAAYEILQWKAGQPEIRWTYWNDFPPDDDDGLYDETYGQTSLSKSTLWTEPTLKKQTKVDKSITFPKGSDWVVHRAESYSTNVGFDIGEIRGNNRTNDRRKLGIIKGGASINPGPITTIDVLVLITNRAMCEYALKSQGCAIEEADPAITDKIQLIEAETNAALDNSGIKDVSIRIVAALVMSADSYDYTSSKSSLLMLQKDDEVQSLRSRYGADLISVIGTIGGPCGIGFTNGVLSIVSWTCLRHYSFTHEIGHNFGCLHNRGNCASNHPFAYGYIDPYFRFRTIMSYQCPGICPRILYFSASDAVYKGNLVGDAANDNARMIRSTAKDVASRKDPAPTVSPPIPSPTVGFPELTCPFSEECPGKNQLSFERLIISGCWNLCVEEISVSLFQLFGWKCGSC